VSRTLVDWVRAGHTIDTGAITMRARKNARAKRANTYHLMFSVCNIMKGAHRCLQNK